MARVLVVEDNAANMTLATFLLRSAGHTVLSATDAEAGLTLARQERPDLILMDIQLPGMDGLQATVLLKKDPVTRTIPVIALTALAMKGDEERIRAAGCDRYIAKPMRYQDFLATVALQLAQSTEASEDGAANRAHILIVDDDRRNRETLGVMLAPEGFFITTASSGEEALEQAVLHHPDLILLDIMLPGMDGYEVAARIKGNPATMNIPVIMVTALDDRDAKMLGLSAGAENFLTKPVHRAELCIRVRNLLRLKAYGDYHNRCSRRLEGEVGSRTADLVESERLYRSTFDASPVGIVHVGLNGEWLRVNQRLCDLLGYVREELEVIALDEIMAPEERARDTESFRQLAAGTMERHVIDEKSYRRRDGSLVWARVNTCVHRDVEGKSQYFISVIEDITEQRTLEARVRQTNKMDAIGRLASGVAHDFNNLLTVIIGFTELVASDRVTANRHGYELTEIVKAAQSAAGLTKQLLTFSRQQVLNATPVDLNALVSDMTGMLRRLIGEQIDVTLDLAPDLGLAFADRGQLAQVLMNLVVNARDAMVSGGSLTITTTDVDLDSSAFGDDTITAGHYVMLSIQDTGSGMTIDTQQRLFEPFFTTKETGKGTGLGLSMTYGIVKQSKGYIGVQSELGQGTTIRVYLPCATSDAVERAQLSVIAA